MQGVVRICLFVLMTVLFAQGDVAQQDNGHSTDYHQARRTRLRHLRHLGDRGLPKAEALRSTEIRNSPNTVSSGDGHRLTIRDNHKPVFTNCSLYRPSFKEEEPPGTFVTQVKAVDRDPPDAGGTVTYSFVLSKQEQKKFNINPNTGVITTSHMFERDEPMREKEVYLTVRATDNGLPKLDDVCTFKVIITDINDNYPVFDKVNYVESVPQDLAPKKEVMRISATDIDDGNNSIVQYDLDGYPNYFHIDRSTGIITLEKPIDKPPGFKFKLNATATDQGEEHNKAEIFLEILVVESHKKPPTFIDVDPPNQVIVLLENRTSYTEPVVTLTAQSNIVEEPDLQFVLVTGRTEQTNKWNTFVLESSGPRASIKQGKSLDYETVSEYTLTVRVQNKFNLAAERQIQIRLQDVNDNIPYFTEVVSGSVLENEPPGTPVMQVRAFDSDGTPDHNQVTYELGDNLDLFRIDPLTGNITTLKEFDREEKDFYNVKVYAIDNSLSAIFKDGKHNRGEQVFRIEIADKNDNAPHFTQKEYVAESIAEDANINALVTEVKALDNDTASPVQYDIIEGNTYDAFEIERLTGKIRVKNQLDYENITSYSLKVRAFDGAYEDFAKVEIKIENVNDNPPEFMAYNKNITIEEEKEKPGCIVKLEAYDPDIPNRNVDQRILYFVVKEEQRKVLSIDKTGCLSLIKPLDRDPPNGYPTWQVLVGAKDEDGTSPTSLQKTTEVLINLIDINDNAPFLDMHQPVVWGENREPGIITTLTAKDYDSDENGPPFIFRVDDSASDDIKSKFGVSGDASLLAKVKFDREMQKVYYLPIAITDSGTPTMTGTSTLTVIIGDENDNAMKPGSSSIFVYNYKGEAPDTDIGRVYVDDPDDWDLPDKSFKWKTGDHPNFSLDYNTGMIRMLYGTSNGSFLLEFTVTEESHYIERHSVDATVNVTVKVIPEEAVHKSGSIRFSGISAEEFVAPGAHGGPSKQQLLAVQLATMLNTSIENVDVFTVLHSPRRNNSLLDVRFSAHGSPYYYPEKLNRLATEHQDMIEHDLDVSMLMINIDECLIENDLCTDSCTNFLNVQNEPYAVYTNTTSFVGVRAVVDPLCTCKSPDPLVCLNGGTNVGDRCECNVGFEGPRCEVIAVGFSGNGWALYPPFQACDESHLSLELTAHKENGLIFYVGPLRKNPNQDVQDFMSLELQGGYPVLLVDYGTGTVKLEQRAINLYDGKSHRLDIIWNKSGIDLNVDNCQKSICLVLGAPVGPNQFLNVNGPLQVGGSAMDLSLFGNQMNWTHKPTDAGFAGCIRNLTYNSKTYNLGMPSDSKNADPGCSRAVATAVSFGIDTNFLVAILVCIAILLILLLAVVVHRRKTDDMYKDMDDIRENIITYEDEGGGEIDAGFDMNVLRMYDSDGQPMLNKLTMKDHLQSGADEVPDICGFLDGKKRVCDNDPETNPFDDVRHYAYEGDGNTTGSLSSLASGTDEGDLNFDYLSNFGPRFRKLADMYGEDPSDEEDNFNNPASESWC